MKTQTYNIFRKRMLNKARDKGFPLLMIFELTYRCNFKCKHCYLPAAYKKKRGELKTKEIFTILDQLKDTGCLYLRFTGGEPFMRKDIMDILRYAKKRGFELIIYTNGSLIDERMVGELTALRPDIEITIPAMSKSVFERISGVVGSRNRVFNSTRLLHKKGASLRLKTCALKANEEEIKDIRDFAASLKIPYEFDAMVLPQLNGSRKPYRYRTRKIEDMIQMEKVDLNRDTTYSWVPDTGDLFNCGAGQMKAAITPRGWLKTCVNIDKPIFNILESSFRNAWEDLKRFVGSIKPGDDHRCAKCELKLYCAWCPGMSWLENRNSTGCNLQCRHFAESRKKNQKQIYRGDDK
ncbi:MAG: radical SAM protein [Candidatus Omnitrophica bacterium]|nr:radical SAM protein [Candidatus Omnitrophota bacterium]